MNGKYYTDFGTVKQYGDKIKVTAHNVYPNPDFDDGRERKYTPKGEAGNEGKLDNNLSRTKSRVFELAYCNPWSYFVTFTLAPDLHNRYDLETIKKQLPKSIRNYGQRHKIDMAYLLLPEFHKDGAIHFHGFVNGIPEENLIKFTLNDKIPYKLREKLEKGDTVYHWLFYDKQYGWNTFEPVRNHEAAAKYIMKYITKDMLRTVTELNARQFLSSQGLVGATVLHKGFLTEVLHNPEYKNDYLAVQYFDTLEEAMFHFEDPYSAKGVQTDVTDRLFAYLA